MQVFGPVCGVQPLSLKDLQVAAAFPLEGPKPLVLEALYTGLLRYLLLQWVTYGGSTFGRVKRWARIVSAGGVERGTWPEVLRRYLLMTRSNMPVKDDELADKRYSLLPDDLMAVQVGQGARGKKTGH